ncbi:MAG TPA: MBL fold metallo-hydrolase [Candidatus Limnocylindrales bacterium]|nr:MBL fold metallo-hydrolase [Candidatus Limnocylindrales bacterium]
MSGRGELAVEVIAHACLRVRSGGRTMLTDPWLFGGIACDSGFLFPPPVASVASLAAETDAIYVSHLHPDHFHPPTLAHFPRTIPVYVAAQRDRRLHDRLRALGFTVVEVAPEQVIEVAGTPFRIAMLAQEDTDAGTGDSAIVIAAEGFALLDTNDCPLSPAQHEWIRDRFRIDYAFVGYSPASHFPASFEMDAAEKQRLMRESGERHYRELVAAALRLRPRLTIPFANSIRFLAPREQWRNASFNNAAEAVRRLRQAGLAGAVLGPGDGVGIDGTLRQLAPIHDKDEEAAAIARYAAALDIVDSGASDSAGAGDVAGQAAGGRADDAASRRAGDVVGAAAGAPAADDLPLRLRDHVLARWQRLRARFPGVSGTVIAYVIPGLPRPRFHLDFSRTAGDVFGWGEPASYDMRFTYPASALARLLDGSIDWDELHFATGVWVHQKRYARDFLRMLHAAIDD